MIRRTILMLMAVLLTGCVAETDFDRIGYEPKLVIDGSIESDGYARVVLTKSASYFADLDSSNIRQYIVSTAKVTVSDGTDSEVLTLRRDDTHYPPFIYVGTSLKGVAGKSYTLTVESSDEIYTATTTVPGPARLDRLWFEPIETEDSVGYLYARMSDNANEDNYYRFFTERVNKDNDFVPIYLSAIGDQYFNGTNFTVALLRGPDERNGIIDDLYFERGDTVRVKLCTMDRAHFDFWRTLERELYVTGNPFSSSGNNIMTNIGGGHVLGVWGGYGVTYYSIVIR